MNDQFKKYVEEHRDDFDHLEPSPAVFLKIKSELKNTPKAKKGIVRLVVNHKWLVAASILIIMSLTYLMLTNNDQVNNTKNDLIVNQKLPSAPTTKVVEEKTPIALKNEMAKNKSTVVETKLKKAGTRPSKFIDMTTVYKDLTDSSSASTRLAAILKIQKSGVINNDIVDRLAHTLNADANSNVRLAALNLMGQYAQDSYINNTFLKSLANQKDPLVQLGLIDLLSHTNNPKLDDKLYALANDPTTFAAVKDQAYLVLLNQNKL